jgi:hypothetical protein
MKAKRLWVALCAVVLPAVANAGWQYNGGWCWKNADNSGGCYGNFAYFRSTPNTSDMADFVVNSQGYRAFYGTYGTVSGSCVPNASVSAIWDRAMDAKGYFYVEWDTLANCTYLGLGNSSAYSTF